MSVSGFMDLLTTMVFRARSQDSLLSMSVRRAQVASYIRLIFIEFVVRSLEYRISGREKAVSQDTLNSSAAESRPVCLVHLAGIAPRPSAPELTALPTKLTERPLRVYSM